MGRLVYGTAHEGRVRFSIVDNSDVVSKARELHGLSFLPTVVLGRLLTAAALVSPWLSERETITFVLSGDGPAGLVAAQAHSDFSVRGYITEKTFELPKNELGKFDVSAAVGKGELTVVRDVGLRTPFVSKVPIVSGEIAQDVAYYFTVSEQIPSAFALGVLMNVDGVVRAGGLAIQVLDKSLDESVIRDVEMRLAGFSFTTASGQMSLEEIISNILGEAVLLTEEAWVTFKCNCSREKAIGALSVLGRDDITELIAEGHAEVTCKWCSTTYSFDENELRKVLAELDDETVE